MGPPRNAEKGPPWILIAGFIMGAVTLFFLMALPVITLLTGKRIDCGDTYLISLIFGLGVGLASAFLGGYAAANGNIRLPFLGGEPLLIGLTGGIAFLAVGAGISYLLTSQSCIDQRLVRARFNQWNYFPADKSASFSLELNEAIPALFVPEKDKSDYSVYVGIRGKAADPPTDGEYRILLGPYDIQTTPLKTQPLSDSDVQSFGNCAEFAVFAVKRDTGKKLEAPFKPRDEPSAQIFNWAEDCKK